MDKPQILLVGPLPPPIHGFSTINAAMREKLSEQADTCCFNTVPTKSVLALFKELLAFLARLRSEAVKAVYVGFSGGARQWIDALYIGIALRHDVPVYVHHHSFAYLGRRGGWFTPMRLKMMRRVRHVALCECMAAALSNNYAVPLGRVSVLSNSAFVQIGPKKRSNDLRKWCSIGYLSAVSFDKGIREYFETMSRLALEGDPPCRGIVAGPMVPEVEEYVKEALAKNPHVRYVGPVYGQDKEHFLNSCDVLFFPTRYKNEAEPVTIWEALAAGTPVVAFDRGCIGDIQAESCCRVLPYSGNFVEEVCQSIRELAADPHVRALSRLDASRTFLWRRSQASIQLEVLLNEMHEGPQRG